MTPNAGNIAGGTTVTIGGTHFSLSADMQISFGGTNATGVSVTSSTSLTCVTPAHAAGVVNITATILSTGETFTFNSGFTYNTTGVGPGAGPISVSGVSPPNGPSVGGTIVTITGQNFFNVTAVIFSGSPATITSVTPTSIQVTTTAHAPGPVNITIVSSTNGTSTFSGLFTYTASGSGTGTMTVTNVTPNHGPLAGGTVVTIDGTNFVSSISVSFAGRNGFNITTNPGLTQVTVTVPSAPAGFTGGPVNLTVTSSNSVAGQVSLIGYSYDGAGGAPVLNSITPNAAPESGGTKVTIIGSNFLQGTSSNVSSVLIGSQQLLNLQILNATQLTGVLPQSVSGATTVIAFGTSGQQSNTLPFSYTPALIVTSLNPNQGPTAGGGRPVTIKGRNFTANNIASITFAGVATPPGQIQFIDTTTVTAIPPASPLLPNGQPQTGPVNVVLTGQGIASAVAKNAYNYGPTFNPPSFANPTGGTAAIGTVLAVQFQAGPPTGAVVIRPTTAIVYSSLATGSTLPLAIPGGGTNLVDVAVADLDGDGDLDVILLDQGSNQIKVSLNNNNMSFGALVSTAIAGGGTPVGMAIGLFNNDGFFDIAVTTRNPDNIYIFQGNGGTSFTQLGGMTITPPANALPSKILVADPKKSTTDVRQIRDVHDVGPQGLDMNGDGKADLVVAFAGLDQVAVYTQSATTPFSFSLSSTAYVGTGCSFPALLALGDLNDTGTLDVVVGNTNTNNISVLTGNGSGAIAFIGSYNLLGPGNQVLRSLIVGDFNRDCRQDIVTSSFNGENISIYLGRGDGTFADATNYDAQVPSLRAGARIESVSPDPTFTFVFALDFNQTAPMTNYVTAIVRATQLFIQGSITAPPYATLMAMGDPQAITFGDLNKDGHKDMVVANRASATIQVYINDGAGNFTTPFAPIGTGLQPESVVVADVNNDGLNDVIVACNGSDAVYIHRNLGGGQIASGSIVPVNARGPHQVVAVDMNNDSNVDIVTVNQYSNSVTCLLNDGTGAFAADPLFAPPGQPAGVYPVGNAPLGLAVADLNNDGRPDIVTANSSDDTVTVLLRANAVGVQIGSSTDYPLGGLIFPAPSQPPGTPPIPIPTVEPVSVAIADLNVDGFLDIVTADKFTSTFTILHGGKGGTAGNFFVPMDYPHYGSAAQIGIPPIKIGTTTNPISVVIYDVNDDGLKDVVIGTFGGAQVQDFLVQGTHLQTTGQIERGIVPPPPLSPDVVPAGETAFVFDQKNNVISYKTGVLITFSAAVGNPVTAMAVGRLTGDCPPAIGTTSPDGNVRLFQVK